MDLLEKFAAVEVKADNRISEKDKFYCEQQFQRIPAMTEPVQRF